MRAGELLNKRYEIISRISLKGFRQKWLATDIQTWNKVIIETLHDDLINDPTAIENIRYELDISRQLNSEMFLRCTSTFLENERIFLIWENNDAEPLSVAAESFVENSIPDHEILKLLIKIGTALNFAHTKGIVHGHLSGENIVVDPNLNPKITNFSINSTASSTDPGAGSLLTFANTCAPEIINGSVPDKNSDVYSLGMIGKILLCQDKNLKDLKGTRLVSLRRDLDLSTTQVIDGLASADPSVRNHSFERLLDENFLDSLNTPVKGIETIKVSRFQSWLINRRLQDKNTGLRISGFMLKAIQVVLMVFIGIVLITLLYEFAPQLFK